MYQFTEFNIGDLTPSQRERIEEVNKRYDERLKNLRLAGLNSVVYESDLETARKLEIEMVVSGHITAVEVKYMLHDLEGNVIDGELMFHDGGHYDMQWVLEKEYVPVPRDISALKKKGYEVYKHELKFTCDFDGSITDLGSPLFKNICLVDDTPVKVENISEVCVYSNWVDFSYCNPDYIKEEYNHLSQI